jgi:hypothetical protein
LKNKICEFFDRGLLEFVSYDIITIPITEKFMKMFFGKQKKY